MPAISYFVPASNDYCQSACRQALAALSNWQVSLTDAQVDDIARLTEALFRNGVQHAGQRPALAVTLALGKSKLVVKVEDGAAYHPATLCAPQAGAVPVTGLPLAYQLCSGQVGWEPTALGRSIWASYNLAPQGATAPRRVLNQVAHLLRGHQPAHA